MKEHRTVLGHLVCASATKSLTFITDNREKTILHLQLELYKESVVQVTGWRVASVVCQVFCFFLEDEKTVVHLTEDTGSVRNHSVSLWMYINASLHGFRKATNS